MPIPMRFLLLLALALGLVGVAHAQDVTFIVNSATKVTSLSPEDAKNILLGNKVAFDDGTAVKLVVQTEGPVHEKIIRDYTHRTTDQFDKYWQRQVFTGKGIMPTHCASDAEVVALVAKTPGAIGYTATSSVTAGVTAVAIK